MRNIGILEARKEKMQVQVTSMNREVDMQTMKQSDLEIKEREVKEDILRLKEHAEVVKK